MKPVVDKEAEESLSFLNAHAMGINAQPVEAGYWPLKEWRRRWKLSKTQSYRLLDIGLESGTMLEKKFTVPWGPRLRTVKHYKWVGKK